MSGRLHPPVYDGSGAASGAPARATMNPVRTFMAAVIGDAIPLHM